MTNRKTIFELLAIGLGNKPIADIPADVDWEKVMDLADVQGVMGIVYEGIRALPKKQMPELLNLLSWIGQSNYMELAFQKYEQTLTKICRILEEKNITPIILKGYGCSLNYPKPFIRTLGDIDIYVTDSNGKHNPQIIEYAEQLLTDSTTSINHSSHHSAFLFEGTTVENHTTILDINTHKSSRYLNEILEQLVCENCKETIVDGIIIRTPSTKFNSIHLLRHMASDFATVTTSLRHILDWGTFVATNDVDWEFVHTIAHKTNMNRFLDAVNGICIEYLGYSPELFPIEKQDDELRDKVLTDVLAPTSLDEIPPMSNFLAYGWAKTKRLWGNRWKHNIVYDESLLESFISHTFNRLRERTL